MRPSVAMVSPETQNFTNEAREKKRARVIQPHFAALRQRGPPRRPRLSEDPKTRPYSQPASILWLDLLNKILQVGEQ